ncbi:uncharacterized protein LOC120354725 [Nilaparvata lugens]|uniref:uncharacterized protein LOC120354725 n=1 Tax=Nilaparvata lugens TaxID=108931 RepID=UPI00193D10A6|nr:uncharacterized protein LOC120354725 [Nilaparvata lugens]
MTSVVHRNIELYKGLFWTVFLVRYVLQPIFGFTYENIQPRVYFLFLENYLVVSFRSTLIFFRDLKDTFCGIFDNVLSMGIRFSLIAVVVMVDQMYSLNFMNMFRVIFRVVSRCIHWMVTFIA